MAETSSTLAVFTAYTGRWTDEVTGLQNNRARWFDAPAGRWISEDPIGFAAGDVNVARYVGNRSVDLSDPSGLLPPHIMYPQDPDDPNVWYPGRDESPGESFEIVLQAFIPMVAVSAPYYGDFGGDLGSRPAPYPSWGESPEVANGDYRYRVHFLYDMETETYSYRIVAGDTINYNTEGREVSRETATLANGCLDIHVDVERYDRADGITVIGLSIHSSGKNPIATLGPEINWLAKFLILYNPNDNSWSFFEDGFHNKFPAYEIFLRADESDFFHSYGYDPRDHGFGPAVGLIYPYFYYPLEPVRIQGESASQ